MELKHLHTQKDDMLIEDRILFDHHQTNIDTMKTYQIQKLISTIAPIVRQSKREAKKLGKRQRRITTYYRPQKQRLHTVPQTFKTYPPPQILTHP